jgi:hypothetical protein
MKNLLAATAAVMLIAACSNDETDYRDAASKAIGSKDAETQLGESFKDIECETPTSKEVGTQFTCTATGNETGTSFEFTAEIKTKSLVQIVAVNPAS